MRSRALKPSTKQTDTSRGGFTLIELLIVVAIIAILAAIAIPNFLEAQVRAKTARARSDMRTIATCLEAYMVDNNHYPPNDGYYNVVPRQITTPVAYVTSNRLIDPFAVWRPPRRIYNSETHQWMMGPDYGELYLFYTYDSILTLEQAVPLFGTPIEPPVEAVDSGWWNPGALEKYGRWRMASNGPDRCYTDPDFVPSIDMTTSSITLRGSDVPYDPTNGTISKGNLIRTQREAEMK